MKNYQIFTFLFFWMLTSTALAEDCRPPMSFTYCTNQSLTVTSTDATKSANPVSGSKKSTPWWKSQWKGIVSKAREIKKEVLEKWLGENEQIQTVKRNVLPVVKDTLPVYSIKDKGVSKSRWKEIIRLVESQKVIEKIEDPAVRKVEFTVPEFSLLSAAYESPKALHSPQVGSSDDLKDKGVDGSKATFAIPQELRVQKRLQLESVQVYTVPEVQEIALSLHEVEKVSEAEVLHLIGRLLVEAGKCHLAVGFLNSASAELASCYFDMGLYQSSLETLSSLIKDQGNYGDILRKWLAKSPRDWRESLGQRLSQAKDIRFLEGNSLNQAHYYQALYHFSQKNIKKTIYHSEQVQKGSDVYGGALLLKAVLQKDFSQFDQEVIAKAKRGEFHSEERAMFLSVAAGLAFQNKKYKDSIELLKKMTKDDFNWVESLVKLGWAQLLDQDPLGAIGNMFSLHTPFFQDLYLPESFVVRTIGYLNICQYGDAYKTLTFLEQKYRPWLDQIKNEMKHNTSSATFTSYFKKYLSQGNAGVYGQLPHEIVKELIRQREVINLQKTIVAIDKELKQYEFINGLIAKDLASEEKNAFKQVKDANGKVIKTVPRSVLAAQRFELLNKAMDQFLGQRKSAEKNLAAKKNQAEEMVGKSMKAYLETMQAHLEGVLENNEFLRFEVFSGSGENMRAIQQGMVEKKRIHRSVKPQSKDLQWAFSGEMWLDEIGHYRSSLKNNCAGRVTASVSTKQGDVK